MGTTFHKLYFFPLCTKGNFVKSVTSVLKKDGYAITDSETFDFEVLIESPSSMPPYISLPAMNNALMQSYASDFAQSTGRAVLSIQVYDSDTFFLVLCSSVGAIAFKCHISDGSIQEIAGCEQSFELLQQPIDYDALISTLRKEYIFEEDRANDILTLLKCSLTEEKQKCLRFIKTNSEERGYEIVREGLPQFECYSHGGNIYYREDFISSFLNIGGPSTGLAISLTGELIDCLHPNDLTNSIVTAQYYTEPISSLSVLSTAKEYSQEGTFSIRELPDRSKALYAEFPSFRVPNGMKIDASKKHTRVPPYEKYLLQYKITISCWLDIETSMTDTPLELHVSPFENWASGQTSCKIRFIKRG